MSIPKTPPGHVRILVERRHDAALAEAARALLSGTEAASHIERYSRSPGLIIDPTFGAIPIGRGAAAMTPENASALLDPDKSTKFLVRGFVEASSSGVPDRIDGELVHSDPLIGSLLTATPPTCGDSKYVGVADTVRQKLNTQNLAARGMDGSGVALAIVDSGIFLPRITHLLGDMKPGIAPPKHDILNSWTADVVTKPFKHRLGHGTMCAFDALIAAPKATLLDIAMLTARPVADHTAASTASEALLAYVHLLDKWRLHKIKCAALVISNSWGIFHPSLDFPPTSSQRFIDNPNHIFRLFVIALAQAGADVVFCGNNCGVDCPSGTCLSKTGGMIMAANTYPEVLTVGGCDTNDNLVGYSSLGPSIPNMYQQKPDLTAYTHFLGSKARRIFLPDTGVSAACPVAAGCVAALRSKTAVPPAQLFDALRQTARAGNLTAHGGGPGGVWNNVYGYGIINPVAAANILGIP
jgi:hypothetical protein